MNVNLNKRCRIEYPAKTQDSIYGTDVITWTLLATIWCEIQDEMPSKTEGDQSGVIVTTKKSRFRARYRSDINSGMRIICDGVTYNIVSAVADIGNKRYIEAMIEVYTS